MGLEKSLLLTHPDDAPTFDEIDTPLRARAEIVRLQKLRQELIARHKQELGDCEHDIMILEKKRIEMENEQ